MTAAGVAKHLEDAGYQTTLSLGDVEDPISAVIEIEDRYENQMDLLLGIRGLDPDASQRSVPATLLGAPVRMMGAEDLVAMKLFAGGPQDIEDVKGILQVSGERLDRDLLRTLARRFGDDVLLRLDDVQRP